MSDLNAGEKRRSRTEYNVSAEVFIQTWQASERAQEVADKLGMPKPIVLARASSYREAGIRLKRMQRHHGRGLNVAALNKLIDDLGATSNTETEVVENEHPFVDDERGEAMVEKEVKDLLEAVDGTNQPEGTRVAQVDELGRLIDGSGRPSAINQ
jgi:hypothetical protein